LKFNIMTYRNKAHILTAAFLGLLVSSLQGIQINEIRVNEPGATDSNEFAEIKGDPGASLDGLWYLVIGDHTAFGSDDGENIPDLQGGTVEFAISLDGFVIPDDGVFLIASNNMQIDVLGISVTDVDYLLTDINFENSDNTTHLIVRDYTGIEVTDFSDQYDDLGVDIDDDNDGVPNATLPWAEVIDAVGIVDQPNDEDPEDYTYGEALGFADVGPDGSFQPGMVFRGSDDNEWNVGEFNLLNEEGTGLFMGDEFNGPALDTPGAENPVSLEPDLTPIISSFTPSTASVGDTVVVDGDHFSGATDVMVGEVAATFTVIDNETIEISVTADLEGGPISVTTPEGQVVSGAELTIISADVQILFSESFDDGLGDFTVISLASDRGWIHDDFGGDFFAEASGFGGDAPSDDWLITPGIDLSGASAPVFSFASARNFDGPALAVLISTDYDGLNPANASWTTIEAPLSQGDYNEVPSGDIDLSAYIGQTVYIAFHYTSDGGESGQAALYQIDDVMVVDSAGGGGRTWNGFEVDPSGYVDTGIGGWLNGFVYVGEAEDTGWVFVFALGKYIYVTPSGWMYISR
jgi:hypothetical protein